MAQNIDTQKIDSVVAASAALEPAPIAPEDVISGSPEGQAMLLWRSEDLKLHNGIWQCSPGEFYLTHSGETIFCLQGRAEMTPEGGETVVFEPGVLAYIHEGTRVRWNISETVRKVFHNYDSTGTVLAGYDL